MAWTTSPHLRTGVACAVIAAEVIAGVVALIVVSTGSSSGEAGARTSVTRSVGPSPSGSSSSPVSSSTAQAVDDRSAQLVAWARRALPLTSPVLADNTLAASLRADGFTDVRTASSVEGTRFVFDTPALRAAAAQQPAVSALLTGSVPVARAGSGDSEVLVREVGDVTAAQLAADARTRLSAETDLLGNTNLRAADQPRRVLAAGELDLRAAAVLALLASDNSVQVVAIGIDPLEQAAGRPARVVDLRAGSVQALRSMLAAVAAGYRLSSITSEGGGVQRLTWPVGVSAGNS